MARLRICYQLGFFRKSNTSSEWGSQKVYPSPAVGMLSALGFATFHVAEHHASCLTPCQCCIKLKVCVFVLWSEQTRLDY